MEFYNNTIHSSTKQHPKIHSNQMKGFFYVRKTDSPLPVSEWAYDGIHFDRYYRNIRSAFSQRYHNAVWYFCSVAIIIGLAIFQHDI